MAVDPGSNRRLALTSNRMTTATETAAACRASPTGSVNIGRVNIGKCLLLGEPIGSTSDDLGGFDGDALKQWWQWAARDCRNRGFVLLR
jgi:hypothetical protein